MDFQKISYDGKDLKLSWETMSAAGSTEKHSYESKDAPHPDFLEALQDLAGVVARACYIDEDADIDVRGVTIKEAASPDGDGSMVPGVTITALRQLGWSNAPLVINTPFNAVELVPCPANPSLKQRLHRLCDEARRYLAGKRNQGDLFAEDEDGDQDGEMDMPRIYGLTGGADFPQPPAHA